MFPSGQLEELVNNAIKQLGIESNNDNVNKYIEETCKKLEIDPSQVLVLAGLLGGVLEVASVVVRRNQSVDVVLTGSLKQSEKTELEKAMEQLGKLPFDEVLKAMIGSINK